MTLLRDIKEFCSHMAEYNGPQEADAVRVFEEFPAGTVETRLRRAFDLGYKRGYADAAEYVADWIENEAETEDEDEEA